MSDYTNKYVVFNENTKTCRYLKSSHVRTSPDNPSELEFFYHSHERLVEIVPASVFYNLRARRLSIRDYKRVFLKKIQETVITGRDIFSEYLANYIISHDDFQLSVL
jgi:hypothetical protein